MPYWRLHYHLIWTTYGREALIDADCEVVLHRALLAKANDVGLLIHAIGNVEDHVHVAVSIPPRLAVAECVGHLKGASAHRVNRETGHRVLRWQGGYGVLSLGERSLPTVIAYVLRQREHHRAGRPLAIFERSGEADDGVVIAAGEERRGLKPPAERSKAP